MSDRENSVNSIECCAFCGMELEECWDCGESICVGGCFDEVDQHFERHAAEELEERERERGENRA